MYCFLDLLCKQSCFYKITTQPVRWPSSTTWSHSKCTRAWRNSLRKTQQPKSKDAAFRRVSAKISVWVSSSGWSCCREFQEGWSKSSWRAWRLCPSRRWIGNRVWSTGRQKSAKTRIVLFASDWVRVDSSYQEVEAFQHFDQDYFRMHWVLVVFEDLAKRHVQIFISKDEHNCCEIENLPAVDLVERVQPVADVDKIPEGVVCTRRLL